MTFEEIRQRLLEGTKGIGTFQSSVGPIQYRALTSGEQAQLEGLLLQGIKANAKINTATGELGDDVSASMDLDKQIKSENSVTFRIVSLAISGVDGQPQIKSSEVENWKIPFVEVQKLADEIKEFSGMGGASVDKMLEAFRKEQEGDADSEPSGTGT